MLWSRMCNLVFKICQQTIQLSKMTTIVDFQRKAKLELGRIDKHESPVCVVLGNEACDLDSAASCLLQARFLNHQRIFSDVCHLPVLNIPRNDFLLKTEVAYFFKHLEIESENLIFRDDVSLDQLKLNNRLRLVLVDWNVLPHTDSHLTDSIVQIVDHHKKECLFAHNKVSINIEPVGSCSTLIGSNILNEAPELLDDKSLLLLMGTILIDVANFSPSAKRATAQDEFLFGQVIKLLPGVDKNTLYNELQIAKEDVSSLSLDQLLRKDAKYIRVDNRIDLAVCGFPMLSATLLKKYATNIDSALDQFASVNNFPALVLIGIEIDSQTDRVQRDIVVYSKLNSLKVEICHQLGEHGDSDLPNLQLVVERKEPNYTLYRQNNIAASRKAIIPILNKMKIVVD